MFAVSSLWIALILVILAVPGGIAAVKVRPHPEPSGLAPAQQAAALAEMGDYEGAWRLYHQALEATPEDVVLWYAVAAEAVETIPGTAVLKGRATWENSQPDHAALKAQLVLQGLSGAAEGKRFTKRLPLGQAYRFDRLPPGSYRLVGSAAGHRLWDLTLSLEDGGESSLDLGKDNSSDPSAELYL